MLLFICLLQEKRKNAEKTKGLGKKGEASKADKTKEGRRPDKRKREKGASRSDGDVDHQDMKDDDDTEEEDDEEMRIEYAARARKKRTKREIEQAEDQEAAEEHCETIQDLHKKFFVLQFYGKCSNVKPADELHAARKVDRVQIDRLHKSAETHGIIGMPLQRCYVILNAKERIDLGKYMFSPTFLWVFLCVVIDGYSFFFISAKVESREED